MEPEPRPRRSIRLSVLLVPLGVLAALGLAVGAFFLGQGTRMSDARRIAEREAAVRQKGQTDRAALVRTTERIERRLKIRNRVVIRRVIRRLKKDAAEQAQASYASGQSSGYSSGRDVGLEEGEETGRETGRDEGIEEGIEKASDDLSCSDDPDVPLPFCE